MISSQKHWLSLRVRLLCLGVLIISSLLPPFIPESALSQEEVPASEGQFLFVEEGFLMKISSLGGQGARLLYTEVLVHTVREGENLEKLSQKYGISVQTIQWANGLQPGTPIRPRDELIILPVDGILHTVRRGQTLGSIAELYDVPGQMIAQQNSIEGSFIIAGQQLIVPGATPIGPVATTASADQPLQFTDRLPNKNIALRVSGKPGTATVMQVFAEAPLTAGVLGMPCTNCFYTQYYRAGHYAVDIQTRGGGPIFAAEAGTVIRSEMGWNGGYGNVVEIDHGGDLVTLYAHNREIFVNAGDTVTRGQQIATMGNSGLVHGPTGIHIHFEVRKDGVKKNPLLYLK